MQLFKPPLIVTLNYVTSSACYENRVEIQLCDMLIYVMVLVECECLQHA